MEYIGTFVCGILRLDGYNIKIHIEMDEMWRFYHDKKHQIRLWWATDHNSGEVIAFWFGTREHKNLDELKKLLMFRHGGDGRKHKVSKI